MILLNIGNTHTQIASWQAGVMGEIKSCPTAELDLSQFAKEQIVAASVVPSWTERVRQAGGFLVSPQHAGGVDLSRIDSTTIGADRLANSIMAKNRFPNQNVVVIDFGTAINIEVITAYGALLGGAILVGRKLLRAALHTGTAQLPEIPLTSTPPTKIGNNTLNALSLGIDGGVIGSVREVLQIIQNSLNEPAIYVGIGGDAEYFLDSLPNIQYGGADFTLRGVALSWEFEV